jgi:hypothetical protein
MRKSSMAKKQDSDRKQNKSPTKDKGVGFIHGLAEQAFAAPPEK